MILQILKTTEQRIWQWMCFVPGSDLKIIHIVSTPLSVCRGTANENFHFELFKNFLSSKFFRTTRLQKNYLIFVMKVCLTVSWHMWIWFQYSTLVFKLIHDRGPYHIETSPLTCKANQWTGFYMTGTSVMKELIEVKYLKECCKII